MTRTVELRRHTEANGDVLTPEGVRAAIEIGRTLPGGYHLVISSGAHRATQTAACLLAGLGRPVTGGVVVDTAFRSKVEDRWFAAARRAAGKGLDDFRKVDPQLVESEAAMLGGALRAVFESLPDGGCALVVGHSPTTEAAVLGLTGQVVGPLAKGAGVRLVEESGSYAVEPASVWVLGSGERVVDRSDTSHVHGEVRRYLPEAFLKIRSDEGQRIVRPVDFGHVIGQTTCVATTPKDEIKYARRKDREGHSRFVLNRHTEPSSSVFVVLERPEGQDHYVLLTAWIGGKAPVEPQDEMTLVRSREFWDRHALLWDPKEEGIDMETMIDSCPWATGSPRPQA